MRSAEIAAQRWGVDPIPARTLPPDPPPLRRSFTRMTFAEVAEHLGWGHFTPQTIVQKLRALHMSAAFPLPRGTRMWKGQPCSGAKCITAHSEWDRWPVESWLDDRDPPPVAAARSAINHQLIRHDLAQRAQRLATGARS